jgi:hypothetical protein
MTFSFSIIKKSIFGGLRVAFGTFTNTDGSTGGTIDLSGYVHYITHVSLQHTGSSAVSEAPAINETDVGIPPRINGSSFKIVTKANTNGIFIATGL